MVYQAARAVRIPVVGLGGIATGEDAAEFLIAGATAVEVGTASFWDPASVERIARELAEFLRREGIAGAGELVGTLEMGAPAVERGTSGKSAADEHRVRRDKPAWDRE